MGDGVKKALVFAGGGSRGAFQIGVWKYLVERGWKPDIICGSSVGAINAAGIVSGLDVETMTRLWTTSHRRKMYRVNWLPFISNVISGKSPGSLFDTRQMQRIVNSHLNIDRLRTSPIKLVLSAVNILTAQTEYFSNENIRLEHVLASSAMPILFPWIEIDGAPYWDGGTMSNIPIQPALDFGAKEILVVFLSPVGHTPQQLPQTLRSALEHIFEQAILSSYQASLYSNKFLDRPLPAVQQTYRAKTINPEPGQGQPNIITLAPSKMLGFGSLINFSLPQARKLIDEGYKTALTHLKPFI